MQQLLISIGIPATVVTSIISLGTLPTIIITLLVLLTRYVLVPKVIEYTRKRKEIRNNFEDRVDRIIYLLENLTELQNKANQDMFDKKNQHDAILNKIDQVSASVDIIVDNNSGSLDADQLIGIIATYTKKTCLESLSFYRTRSRVNHIIQNPRSVRQRYLERADYVAAKFTSYIGKYHLGAKPAIGWVGKESDNIDPAQLVWLTWFVGLYDLQYCVASGDPCSVVEEDLYDIADSFTSQIVDCLRVWCLNPTDNNKLAKTFDESVSTVPRKMREK